MNLDNFKLKPYKPSWWSNNCHLQSVIPNFLPVKVNYQYIWEELRLFDGDFIDVAHVNTNASGPIVILLHGLEGSINSFYIKNAINTLIKQDWKICVMHFRSCSGRVNESPIAYHGGINYDFDYFIKQLKGKFPEKRIYAVGFSIGGCVLSQYLARSETMLIDAGIAISMPFQLDGSVDSTPPFYLKRLVRSLKKKTLEQIDAGVDMLLDKQQLNEIQTLRDFDEAVTAPMFDFSSADEYYSKESVRQYLCKIQAPLLILHALDDPFVPVESIPNDSELNENVKLHCTTKGGHVGFVYGTWPWTPQYWNLETMVDFLSFCRR